MTAPVPADTVPDYQSLMLPVLRAAAAGEQRIGTVVQSLGEELGLSEAARAALLASGRQTIFANRVHWAKTYLAKAGLVEATRRGHFRLTQRGADALAANLERIDNRVLSRFEEFRQFSDRSAKPADDEVVIQAKRYAAGNTVGPGAIRDFFGSLDRHKAAKGLFVTTSNFTSSARETADYLSKRIVLIDGEQLTRLMIRHNVGCRIEEVLHVKKVDEDFFE